MLKKYISMMRGTVLAGLLMYGASLPAQTTASGVINGSLNNTNGIAIQFDSDPAGVTLGAAGTNAATANFGKRGAIWRMASCLAWSRLLVRGPIVRRTKERPLDSTGPPTLASQGEQEADEH